MRAGVHNARELVIEWAPVRSEAVMRTTLFSSAILAAAALFASACEPEEEMGPGQGPGTMVGQNPAQTANDASTPGPVVDAAAPRADAAVGATVGGGTGGGATGGTTGGATMDAGGTIRTDAGVAEAGVSDASAAVDGGAPSEAGPGGWSPCPGGGMPCKILPFGDSITYGLDSQGTSTGSYRVALIQKARAANQSITFVGKGMPSGPMTTPDGQPFPRANEGWSGWTIDGIADRVPSPALDDKPHITLLMIGTNDVSFGDLGGIFGGGDLAGAPARLGMLIDALISSDPNMLVVVAQITPRGSAESGPMPDANTEAYNRGVVAEAERRASAGKHVLLVDMYKGFPKTGLSDFVHPNKVGYDWMAGVWYESIKSFLR